jgi:hypothetical protein
MHPITIYFHQGCADGFAAMWALKKRYPKAITIQTTCDKFVADEKPEGDYIIVDVPVPLSKLRTLCNGLNTVTLIDHHQQEPEIQALLDQGITSVCSEHTFEQDDVLITRTTPDIFLVYEHERAACELAWSYANPTNSPRLDTTRPDGSPRYRRNSRNLDTGFHPAPQPWFFTYISQNDRGTYDSDDVKYIATGMFDLFLCRPNGFELMMKKGPAYTEILRAVGKCSKTKLETYITIETKKCKPYNLCTPDGRKHRCLVTVCPSYMLNDMSRAVLTTDHDLLILFYYNLEEHAWKYKLRSSRDRDCVDICKAFGYTNEKGTASSGGGHMHAAGFMTKCMPEELLEPYTN